MAHMQARVGPMEAGRFHGVLQIVADGIKSLQKESITPRAADRWVLALAPAVTLIPVILVYGFIPTAPTWSRSAPTSACSSPWPWPA